MMVRGQTTEVHRQSLQRQLLHSQFAEEDLAEKEKKI